MIARIQKYINQRGITQAAFARRINVSAPKLWRWMNGYTPIPADQLQKIDVFLKSEGLCVNLFYHPALDL